MPYFFESVTLMFDLDLLTKEKALPQTIHRRKMQALSLTIQKSWLMLKFSESNRETERQDQKNIYFPLNLSLQGHRNTWGRIHISPSF